MLRAQNWRFGSSFSIKAPKSVTGLPVGNTDSGLSVRLVLLFILFSDTIECLFCLGCIATILGMPLTTLIARHDIVTVRVIYASLSAHMPL
jgi:hypothetical protein